MISQRFNIWSQPKLLFSVTDEAGNYTRNLTDEAGYTLFAADEAERLF